MKHFSTTTIAFLLSASVLVLAGCASPEPRATNTATAQPPTPTETAAVEPVVTPAPETQIPQSCEDLFPTSAITEQFGTAATLTDRASTAIGRAIEVQEGTMMCSWRGKTDRKLSGAAFVRRNGEVRSADASRNNQTESGIVGGLGVESSEVRCSYYGRIDCDFSATAGDYYVYGYLGAEVEMTEKQGAEAVMQIFGPGLRSLEVEKSPPLWEAPAGSWPLTVDCQAIENEGEVSAAAGLRNASVQTNPGYEEYVPTPEVAEIGGTTQCTWSGEAAGSNPISHFEVTAVAGGAWYWDAAEPDDAGVILEVPGADDAALRCDGDRCTADARIGNNAVLLQLNMFGNGSAGVSEAQWTELLTAVVAGLPEAE